MLTEEAIIHRLASALVLWQRYDPAVKVDLFSTLITTPAGIYVIDPSPLPPSLSSWLSKQPVAGIVVTNANHARAAAETADRLDLPIYAHPDARTDLPGHRTKEISADAALPGLNVINLSGAAPGEIALHCEADAGTLILGDTLINMGSLGFTYLPTKYCTNAKLMRKSLRQLLSLRFERILFAHGTPIVSHAADRLAALLAS